MAIEKFNFLMLVLCAWQRRCPAHHAGVLSDGFPCKQ
jgi:hypothetical protein